MPDDDTYNGWVNRETWAAALHLSNDYDLYQTMLALARDNPGRAQLADAISEWVDENIIYPVLYPDPGRDFHPPTLLALARNMIADVGSFWRVDWRAVADSFREE